MVSRWGHGDVQWSVIPGTHAQRAPWGAETKDQFTKRPKQSILCNWQQIAKFLIKISNFSFIYAGIFTNIVISLTWRSDYLMVWVGVWESGGHGQVEGGEGGGDGGRGGEGESRSTNWTKVIKELIIAFLIVFWVTLVSDGNGLSTRSCEGISGADELSLGYTCYIWESMNQWKDI